MNKIRISEFEVFDIEKQIEDKIEDLDRILFNYGDMMMIALFAMAKTIEIFDEKLEGVLTLDEAADTFQTLLDLANSEKYRPLMKFLEKIGGD